MASESGDPFENLSPTPFASVDGQDYEALLGNFFTSDTPDTPMHDFQDRPDLPTPAHEVARAVNGETQGMNTEMAQHDMEENEMNLFEAKSVEVDKDKHDSTDTHMRAPAPKAKGEAALTEAALTEAEQGDRISSLLDSDTENEAYPPKSQSTQKRKRPTGSTGAPNIVVKKEPSTSETSLSRFNQGEIIDLTGPEEDLVVAKEEEVEKRFLWNCMPADTISISDDEDEDVTKYVVGDDGLIIPIKKEKPDVEFLWANMGDEVIDLHSDVEPTPALGPELGKHLFGRQVSRPKRTSAEIKKMQLLVQKYREQVRAKSGNVGPQTMPEAPQGPSQPIDSNHGTDDDPAWISSDYHPDEDAVRKFKDLKRSYKAKVKPNRNTIKDDVQFRRAEKAENTRLERLKAEYDEARSSSDSESSDGEMEAEESLFVTPSPTQSSSSKRMATNDNTDNDSVVSKQTSRAKKRRINVQPEPGHYDSEQEHATNMLAGIEEFLGKKLSKADKAEEAAGTAQDGRKRKSKRQNGGPKKQGTVIDVRSLLSGNLFDETTQANLSRDALIVSPEGKKAETLKSMIANIPHEDLRQARAQKNDIQRATVHLAKRKVSPDGKGGWRLPGLVPSLHNHQVLGASWMKEREEGNKDVMGGILADSMGLGKTIMTLATMIAHPPGRNAKERCTLIVCPPGLIAQWEREIMRHVQGEVFPVILKHHTTTRLSGVGAKPIMQNADVILTTYPEVVKSYPKPGPLPEDITTEKDLIDWWNNRWDDTRDVLHKVNFYRVVLDESQAIKNHKTHTSIACRALMARYRWALSGTPITNKIEELYPYFQYLRVPFRGNFNDFQKSYCIPGSTDCNERLLLMLSQFMLRRKHSDHILGAPIVKLPKYHFRDVELDFNIVERKLYQLVFRKYISELNQASADGKLEKHPGMGLCAILRLRQMATHPFLVQKVLQLLFEPKNVDRLEEQTIFEVTPRNRPEREMIAALRRMILAKNKAPIIKPKVPSRSEKFPSNKLVAKFGRYLRSLMDDSNWVELKHRVLCYRCGDPPEEPLVTSCLHLYCAECLGRLAGEASANNEDHTACLKCGTFFTESQPCNDLKELDFGEAKLKLLKEAKEKSEKGKVVMDWVSYDNKLVLSAKTTAVRDQIETWLRDEPDKKIIIFSQFHMAMQILEQICERKEWKFCVYNGQMTHKARDQAINLFAKDKDMRIMIASLKCGGVGLNLTMASKVICVDLWFNSAIEEQAFCRVFRIGQESETFVTRFVVKGTADENLMETQIQKDAMISNAMDGARSPSSQSVEEIMRLFGEVQFDKHKRPFIAIADDEKLDSILE